MPTFKWYLCRRSIFPLWLSWSGFAFPSHGLKAACAANFKLAVFWVAEQNGQVLGYAGMQCVMGECYINNIAVFPQFRGMGIGTRLVQMLMEQAIQRDGVFISLEVRVSNQQAISIYRKLGFHEVGCRKNFYTAPVEDGLIMTKEFKSQ